MNGSAVPLPDGWGAARLVSRNRFQGNVGRGLPRSHASDGTTLIWQPAEMHGGPEVSPGMASHRGRFACDLEATVRFDSETIRRLDLPGSWPVHAWVLTELTAKLTRMPILTFLRRHGTVCPSAHRGFLELPLPGGAGAISVWIAEADAHVAGFARLVPAGRGMTRP